MIYSRPLSSSGRKNFDRIFNPVEKEPEYAYLIRDLIDNIYCRVAPSKIHGCGLIAVRNILAGTSVIRTLRKRSWVWLPIAYDLIDPGVRKMLVDFCPFVNGNARLQKGGLNDISIDYFLNHSDDPNCHFIKDELIAIRDIQTEEEVTVNYKQCFRQGLQNTAVSGQ
jgi:SET domain-containing protein